MNTESEAKTDTTTHQRLAKDFKKRSPRQIFLVMSGVMLAMLLAALSQTIVATAMPGIIMELGGFERYTWAATAYLVSSTVAIPIVGRLSDLYGRKIFFILGLVIFMIASLLAGLSQSMTQLIIARAIQGLGGGIIMVNSLVAIADLFPPRARGRLQGLFGLVYGISSVIGPFLGGFITDTISWNWIFLFNVPAGIPVLWLILRTYPNIRPEEMDNPRLDYPGMLTLVLAVTPVLLALSWGGVLYPWNSPQILGFLVFGLIMIMAFLVIESKSDSPIMPLGIYANQGVSVAVVAASLTGFGLYGSILFIPLFFQGVLGTSATSSGSFLTPMILGIVFGAILSGLLLSITGRFRIQALINTATMTMGMFLIFTMNENTSFALAMLYIAIMGFGLGGTLATFNVAVQNSVSPALLGMATSTLQFFRLVGGVLGLSVLGVVMTNRFATRLEETLPDAVRTALPPDRLDAIRDNPRSFVDPSTVDTLRTEFAESGSEGIHLADMLFGSLNSALAGAVRDVFLVNLVVIAFSLIASLFLKMPGGATQEKESTSDPSWHDPQ